MANDEDIIINAKVKIKAEGTDQAKRDIASLKEEAKKAVRDVAAAQPIPKREYPMERAKYGNLGSPDYDILPTTSSAKRDFEMAFGKVEKSIDKFSRLVDAQGRMWQGTESPASQLPGKYRDPELAALAAAEGRKKAAEAMIKSEIDGMTSLQRKKGARAMASAAYQGAGGGEAGLSAIRDMLKTTNATRAAMGWPAHTIPVGQGIKDAERVASMHMRWAAGPREKVWETDEATGKRRGVWRPVSPLARAMKGKRFESAHRKQTLNKYGRYEEAPDVAVQEELLPDFMREANTQFVTSLAQQRERGILYSTTAGRLAEKEGFEGSIIPFTQKQIQSALRASAGEVYNLHTHPSGNPVPSPNDLLVDAAQRATLQEQMGRGAADRLWFGAVGRSSAITYQTTPKMMEQLKGNMQAANIPGWDTEGMKKVLLKMVLDALEEGNLEKIGVRMRMFSTAGPATALSDQQKKFEKSFHGQHIALHNWYAQEVARFEEIKGMLGQSPMVSESYKELLRQFGSVGELKENPPDTEGPKPTEWRTVNGRVIDVNHPRPSKKEIDEFLDRWRGKAATMRSTGTPEGAQMPGGMPPAQDYRMLLARGLTRNPVTGAVERIYRSFYKGYMYTSPEEKKEAVQKNLEERLKKQQGTALYTPTYLYASRGHPPNIYNAIYNKIAGAFYKAQYKVTAQYADSAAAAAAVEEAKANWKGVRNYAIREKMVETALGEKQVHEVTIGGEMSEGKMIDYQNKIREHVKAMEGAGGMVSSPQVEIVPKMTKELTRYSLAADMVTIANKKMKVAQRELFMYQMQALGLFFSMRSVLGTVQGAYGMVTQKMGDLGGIFKNIALGLAFTPKGSKLNQELRGMLGNTQGIVQAWKNYTAMQATVQAGFAKLAVSIFTNDIFMERLWQIVGKFFDLVSDPAFIDNVITILEKLLEAGPTILEFLSNAVGWLRWLVSLPGAVPILASIMLFSLAAQGIMAALSGVSFALGAIRALLLIAAGQKTIVDVIKEALGLQTAGTTVASAGGLTAGQFIIGFAAGIALGMAGIWVLIQTGVMQWIADIGRICMEKSGVVGDAWKILLAPIGVVGSILIDTVTGQVDKIPEHIVGIYNQMVEAFNHIFVDPLNGVLQRVTDIVNQIRSIMGMAPIQSPAIKGARQVNTGGFSYDEQGNIIHYGTGGIVTKPQLALVGESGPEAIIPLNAIRQYVSASNTAQKTVTTNDVSKRFDIHETFNIGSINEASNADDTINRLRTQNIYGQRLLS